MDIWVLDNLLPALGGNDEPSQDEDAANPLGSTRATGIGWEMASEFSVSWTAERHDAYDVLELMT
jgi:hypothetical protein